jgi:hypothetical protein
VTLFRFFLAVEFVCLTGYTLLVGSKHGWNLLPVFFVDIATMTWPGQFNFDFMTFLLLSGLWLAWRNNFSVAGLVLGMIGVFGGMMFLAPYLLYASFQAQGDIKVLLLGKERAGV